MTADAHPPLAGLMRALPSMQPPAATAVLVAALAELPARRALWRTGACTAAELGCWLAMPMAVTGAPASGQALELTSLLSLCTRAVARTLPVTDEPPAGVGPLEAAHVFTVFERGIRTVDPTANPSNCPAPLTMGPITSVGLSSDPPLARPSLTFRLYGHVWAGEQLHAGVVALWRLCGHQTVARLLAPMPEIFDGVVSAFSTCPTDGRRCRALLSCACSLAAATTPPEAADARVHTLSAPMLAILRAAAAGGSEPHTVSPSPSQPTAAACAALRELTLLAQLSAQVACQLPVLRPRLLACLPHFLQSASFHNIAFMRYCLLTSTLTQYPASHRTCHLHDPPRKHMHVICTCACAHACRRSSPVCAGF